MEVHYNGVWGTVCDDGWDLNDAQVVCDELGLGKAVAARHNAFYGQGSGQIWLDELHCIGSEESIRNCGHSGWGSHNCAHEEDASVKCTVGRCINIYLCVYTARTHNNNYYKINGSY